MNYKYNLVKEAIQKNYTGKPEDVQKFLNKIDDERAKRKQLEKELKYSATGKQISKFADKLIRTSGKKSRALKLLSLMGDISGKLTAKAHSKRIQKNEQ